MRAADLKCSGSTSMSLTQYIVISGVSNATNTIPNGFWKSRLMCNVISGSYHSEMKHFGTSFLTRLIYAMLAKNRGHF
jgi:hypothetical protein